MALHEDSGSARRGDELRFLVGPTASGKSELALRVAERAGAEIVSMDSMLVYRGMDVGTAKPGRAARARVQHHVLDRVDPSEAYSVHRFVQDAGDALESVRRRGRPALLVGGTALYLKALTHGLFEGPSGDPGLRARVRQRVLANGPEASHAELERVDPQSARRIHENDTQRLVRALEVFEQTGRTLSDWQREWSDPDGERSPGRPRTLVGLVDSVAELDRRICERTRAMLDAGWAEEALAIRSGPGFGPTASHALGYSDVLRWADGEIERAECEESVYLATRRFARRQRTWFRSFPEIVPVDVPRDARDMVRAADEVARALDI